MKSFALTCLLVASAYAQDYDEELLDITTPSGIEEALYGGLLVPVAALDDDIIVVQLPAEESYDESVEESMDEEVVEEVVEEEDSEESYDSYDSVSEEETDYQSIDIEAVVEEISAGFKVIDVENLKMEQADLELSQEQQQEEISMIIADG